MINNKILTEELLKFLKDVLKLCNENSGELSYYEEKWPIFYSDGKYKKFETKKIPEYDYFIRQILNSEIQKLTSYSIITKFLITPDIKKYNQKILGNDFTKSSDFTKILPLKFIIRYLEQTQKIQFERKGLIFSGMSPDNKLPEIIELKNHPWFIGVQFHPEFKSRPLSPHPLFSSFIKAAKNYK